MPIIGKKYDIPLVMAKYRRMLRDSLCTEGIMRVILVMIILDPVKIGLQILVLLHSCCFDIFYKLKEKNKFLNE